MKASEVEPILTALGIPLEAKEEDDLSLEITPNRPDWLSVEGVARSCYSYRTGKPKQYAATKSGLSFIVDKSVSSVRPILGSAVVRNVAMTEALLTSLIQLQEKLHDTIGRGRKKMAIGLHDMSSISSPFTYKAVGRGEVRFVPLGKPSSMSCGQILMEHEKGIAYANLVGEQCPLIVDSKGEVLSFPPIINGERTRVGLETTDILIDCTGTSKQVVQITVNIIAAALADRGAKVESIQINGAEYPVFSPQTQTLPLEEANSLLGMKMSAEQVSSHLRKLGHEVIGKKVLSPAFRADILHHVDLIEDIAISIGYNNIAPEMPSFASTGKAEDISSQHEALLGLGYFEAMSWILTSQKVLEKSLLDPSKSLKVKNPLTEDFTTLRPLLYPNMLEIFSRSKSEAFPQFLYEIGPVHVMQADGGLKFDEKTHICAAGTHPKACFSEVASHLSAFLSAHKIEFRLEDAERSGFIPGRCANIIINGEASGFVGEIHPQVLENFSLEQPVALFEVDSAYIFGK